MNFRKISTILALLQGAAGFAPPISGKLVSSSLLAGTQTETERQTSEATEEKTVNALEDMGKPPYGEKTKSDRKKKDPSLKMMSSELGVKKLNGQTNMDPIVKLSNVLYEGGLDTLEDIMVHLGRVPYTQGWKELPSDDDRKIVVVLGSGWAAHALMKVADSARVKLIVVSPTNHFAFTPMLASSAVGRVEFRSMTEATRSANPMIDNFIEGEAVGVDVENKKVKVQLNSLLDDVIDGDPPTIDLNYDHLIVSVGTKVAVGNIPGAAEHCLRLKTCEDARNLRRDIGEAMEYASRPDLSDDERRRRLTFVVCGGGPTGVELAGELADFVGQVTSKGGAYRKLKGLVKIALVHGGAEILPQFESKMRKAALKTLQSKLGVEVILNTRVTRVEEDVVELGTKIMDNTGKATGERSSSILPMGLTVWCAGNEPQAFTKELMKSLPADAEGVQGRVNVDPWFRAPMHDPELLGSIMVVGDAAAQKDNKQSFLPQTAQVAGQQGAYAARLIMRNYDLADDIPFITNSSDIDNWLKFRNLEEAPPFQFLNLGILAYAGGGEALAQVQFGDFPVFSWAGSVGYLLWKSVYLAKQVATRNRVLISFDWLKTEVFGRDTTRL